MTYSLFDFENSLNIKLEEFSGRESLVYNNIAYMPKKEYIAIDLDDFSKQTFKNQSSDFEEDGETKIFYNRIIATYLIYFYSSKRKNNIQAIDKISYSLINKRKIDDNSYFSGSSFISESTIRNNNSFTYVSLVSSVFFIKLESALEKVDFYEKIGLNLREDELVIDSKTKPKII